MLVCPGDIVIGDADGVIVVPRAQVARFAREILAKDKFARQQLYKSIGMPSDRTVE